MLRNWARGAALRAPYRAQTRVTRSVRRARFPYLRTIEEFDFTFQTSVRMQMLGTLLGPELVSEGRSAIFSGLPGRVAVVGGTGGLGRALARWLAARGAVVTVVGRTFRDADVPRVSFVKADLSLMSEARRVVGPLAAEALGSAGLHDRHLFDAAPPDHFRRDRA